MEAAGEPSSGAGSGPRGMRNGIFNARMHGLFDARLSAP